MKPTERQKICSQCDGRIPVEAVQCMYCGADVTRLSEPANVFKHQAIEDSLTSLYKPPYAKSNNQPSTPPSERYEQRYESRPQETVAAALPREKEEEQVPVKQTILATLVLSIGANLLILGLLQLFFSENGALTLQWSTKYWFLYALMAAPFLYFGIRKLGSK